MTGTCCCCGRTRIVQRHHPGRRECTDITIPACQECHSVLTIWDGGMHGQRHWSHGTPGILRVKAGIVDVLNLVCIRSGWRDMSDELEQIIKEFSPLFTVRYSASDTAYTISEVVPDNRIQQITEIRTMMEAYQQ